MKNNNRSVINFDINDNKHVEIIVENMLQNKLNFYYFPAKHTFKVGLYSIENQSTINYFFVMREPQNSFKKTEIRIEVFKNKTNNVLGGGYSSGSVRIKLIKIKDKQIEIYNKSKTKFGKHLKFTKNDPEDAIKEYICLKKVWETEKKIYLIFYKDINGKFIGTLIMPLLNNGDLFTYLDKYTDLAELERTYIFSLIIQAVIDLHQKNICHNDLKLENINYNNGKITLLDFGAATQFSGSPNDPVSIVGTSDYMSPERQKYREYYLANNPLSEDYRSLIVSTGLKNQDVYALGKIFYGLFPEVDDPKWDFYGFKNTIELFFAEPHLRPDLAKVLYKLNDILHTETEKQKEHTLLETVHELSSLQSELISEDASRLSSITTSLEYYRSEEKDDSVSYTGLKSYSNEETSIENTKGCFPFFRKKFHGSNHNNEKRQAANERCCLL